MTVYQKYLDHIMKEYTSGEYKEEGAVARAQFAEWAGVIDEESQGFEQKMAQFVDWFLFDRPVKGSASSPVQKILEDRPQGIQDDISFFESISTSRHSLFQFLNIKKEDLYIKDLFSGYTFIIKNSDVIHGFDKEVLFESRIIPLGESFVFTGAFCFHPPQANKYILKEIKKLKKLPVAEQDSAREGLIMKLFKMKYRLEHYRHFNVEKIYSQKTQPKL